MGYPEGSFQWLDVKGGGLSIGSGSLTCCRCNSWFHHSQPKHPIGSTVWLLDIETLFCVSFKCISVICTEWICSPLQEMQLHLSRLTTLFLRKHQTIQIFGKLEWCIRFLWFQIINNHQLLFMLVMWATDKGKQKYKGTKNLNTSLCITFLYTVVMFEFKTLLDLHWIIIMAEYIPKVLGSPTPIYHGYIYMCTFMWLSSVWINAKFIWVIWCQM